MDMTPETVQTHFELDNGAFQFARWVRPIVPVVFGVDDATLAVVKGAIEAIAQLAGHDIAETDPEMGTNLMYFFVADWSELTDVPDLQHLIPEMASLVETLEKQDASQYRLFRFEKNGAIRAAFVFLRMKGALAELPATSLALSQAVQTILRWAPAAFRARSPLARLPESQEDVLRPEVAALIRAAYDPILPPASNDPSVALRLAARVALLNAGTAAKG